jgi:diaminopimelate epimerase
MKLIKELGLAGTKNGKITVGVIEEPYGAGSGSVASIAISLSAKSTEPDWKVHLPKENIDDVIAALTEAKKAL